MKDETLFTIAVNAVIVIILVFSFAYGMQKRIDEINTRIEKIGIIICTSIDPMPKECEFKLYPVKETLIWKSEGEE